MAKFRTSQVAPGILPGDTTNLAGGEAFSVTPELELCSILFTSFLEPKFYETEEQTCQRIAALVARVDPLFCAKAAILARREYGMRSVTHLVAAELAPFLKGKPYSAAFYHRVVRRPDDACEILAAFLSRKGKKIPSRMKRGLGKALSGFGEYSLAKYKQDQSALKLVDAVNLCHPRATEPLGKLIKGTLTPPHTWEVRLTQAGRDPQKKADAWETLLKEERLGYLALLRNVRNILQAAPHLVNLLCTQLTDAEAIRGSLVMPFRFVTAIKTLQKDLVGPEARQVLMALNAGVDLSLSNAPAWPGDTLVVLDTSGSMVQRPARAHGGEGLCPAEIGALFGVVMAKKNAADFLLFSTEARYWNYNPQDSTLTLAQSIPFHGGGTNFHSIFSAMTRRYDRVVILSDMQGWMAPLGIVQGWGLIGGNPAQAFHAYRTRFHADPKVFSFDLAGYGTLQFPERNVYALSGFNGDAVFRVMNLLEESPNALLDMVRAVEL